VLRPECPPFFPILDLNAMLARVILKMLTKLMSLAVVLSSLSVPLMAQDESGASPTQWVSSQGKAIEADFVRLDEETLTLRLKTTGKEVSVPLPSLSLESHLQALKLAEPEAFAKPLLQAPVKPVIEDFEPSFTLSGEELLKSPFPSNPTIEQFLDTFIAEVERGNVFVTWHALPPKMQTDVETLMFRVLGAVKPPQWVQVRALMKSVKTIVQEKKEFILGYPDVASQAEMVQSLDADWHKLAAFTASITTEANWQKENFEQGKILPWVANISALLAPYVVEGLESAVASGAPKLLQYTIKNQSAATAEVEILFGPMPPIVTRFQKVGQIWLIPAQMNAMRSSVDQGLAQIPPNLDTSPISAVLLGVNAVAGSLARASTQAEFNEAIEQLKMLVPQSPGGPGGFSVPGGGGSAPGSNPPGAGGPSFSPPGGGGAGGSGGNRPGRPSAAG
jgi:hypothetical protein